MKSKIRKPEIFHFKTILEYRYSFLFFSIIAILVFLPIIEHTQSNLVPIFFFLVMIGILRTLELSKILYRVYLVPYPGHLVPYRGYPAACADRPDSGRDDGGGDGDDAANDGDGGRFGSAQ